VAVKGNIANLPACPFVPGPKIEDPRLFVGRREELRAIRTRMTGAQPISLNIYGERRIGKSSLLFHFFQTNAEDPNRFIVAYISLQDSGCATQAGFYAACANALLARPAVSGNAALATPLRAQPMDAAAFGGAVRAWKQQGVLPVLCLDEFEALMERAGQFDNDFFNHLRALMDESALMLVIASLEPLDVYQKQHKLTSRFFNLGHVQRLGRLKADEAQALARLPAGAVPGAQPALNDEEQRLALRWGRQHPYLLQLACSKLCEARQTNRDYTWAKREFDAQAARMIQPAAGAQRHLRRWWRPLRWLLVDVPMRVGGLAKHIGLVWNDVVTWAVGAGIIVLAAAVLARLISGEQAVKIICWLFGQCQ
jgi:hypothetical protein